jgi:hypothetical protein
VDAVWPRRSGGLWVWCHKSLSVGVVNRLMFVAIQAWQALVGVACAEARLALHGHCSSAENGLLSPVGHLALDPADTLCALVAAAVQTLHYFQLAAGPNPDKQVAHFWVHSLERPSAFCFRSRTWHDGTCPFELTGSVRIA